MANDAQQGVNMLFQSVRIATSTAEVSLSFVNELVKNMVSRDLYARELKKAVRTGDTSFVAGEDHDISMVRKELESRSIPFMEGQYGNGKGLIFPTKYTGIVNDKVEEIHRLKVRSSEISPLQLSSYSGGGDCREITGLDSVHTELLKDICNQRDIPYNVIEKWNGEFAVRYAAKDTGRMERARMDTIAALNGEHGKILLSQLEWSNENYLKVEKQLRSELPKENVYYVDGSGKELMARNNEVIYSDGDFKMEIQGPYKRSGLSGSKEFRDYRGYVNKVRAALSSMEHDPVRLTEQEYREYQKTENKADFLVKKQRESGRPALSHEEIIALGSMNARLIVMEEKLLIEHPSAKPEPFVGISLSESLVPMTAQERSGYESVLADPATQSIDGMDMEALYAADRGVCSSELSEPIETSLIEEEILGERNVDRVMDDVSVMEHGRAAEDMELDSMVEDLSWDE